MRNLNITRVYTTMLVMIALISLSTLTYGQVDSRGQVSNIIAGSDTLYLLDGRKIPANIMEFEETDYVAYGNWDSSLRRLTNIQYFDKSELHYIYAGSTYHLINEVSEQDNIDRLRRNLLIYERRSRAGMVTLTTGVSLVLAGSIWAEVQSNKIKEPQDLDDIRDLDDISNMPKYLNYGGLGLMLIGGMIKIGSYEFLERGSIDITPVGVRVNF